MLNFVIVTRELKNWHINATKIGISGEVEGWFESQKKTLQWGYMDIYDTSQLIYRQREECQKIS